MHEEKIENEVLKLMYQQEGYEIEEKMKQKYRGKDHWSDAVDFQNRHNLYEVKFCQYVGHDPKNKSYRFGRWNIITENHQELLRIARREGKKAKYILVTCIHGHYFKKVIDANNLVMTANKKNYVPVHRIFR